MRWPLHVMLSSYKSSRSLSHLLMSSCLQDDYHSMWLQFKMVDGLNRARRASAHCLSLNTAVYAARRLLPAPYYHTISTRAATLTACILPRLYNCSRATSRYAEAPVFLSRKRLRRLPYFRTARPARRRGAAVARRSTRPRYTRPPSQAKVARHRRPRLLKPRLHSLQLHRSSFQHVHYVYYRSRMLQSMSLAPNSPELGAFRHP